MTEEDLTPLQTLVLSVYLDVTKSFYFACYGPLGLRGAVLREETEEEAWVRQAFEEVVKTPEQCLQERIANFLRDQCVILAMGPIHSLFVEEEKERVQIRCLEARKSVRRGRPVVLCHVL